MAHLLDSASPASPEPRLRGSDRQFPNRYPASRLRLAVVPLLAVCAALALVLLTPSPAPANITEGRSSVGAGGSVLTVAVFADVADAQDGVPSQGVASSGSITAGDAAYIANGADPRNTFSGSSLYVSNQSDAYNTVLITAVVAGLADGACAEATVRNRGSRESVTVMLAPTSEAPVDGVRTYQGIVALAVRDTENAEGPACDDYTAGSGTPAVLRSVDRDRIGVTAQGVPSSVELVVDGEGPEVRVYSPQPDSYFRSVVVNFSFDVRDEGAGLRHDGEFETSPDGDPRPVNVDGDQLTSQEPRSTPDGGAADIHAYLSRDGGDAVDITPYGTSRWKVIETGKVYALSVDVNLGGSGAFDLEFEATDRTGNTTVADSADVAVTPRTPPPRRSRKSTQRRRRPSRSRSPSQPIRPRRSRRPRQPRNQRQRPSPRRTRMSSPGWQRGYRHGKRGCTGCRRGSSRSPKPARLSGRRRSNTLLQWCSKCSAISYHASSADPPRLHRASPPRLQRVRLQQHRTPRASPGGAGRPGRLTLRKSARPSNRSSALPRSSTPWTPRPANAAAAAVAGDAAEKTAHPPRRAATMLRAAADAAADPRRHHRNPRSASCRSVPCSSPRRSNAPWKRCATSRLRRSRSS